MQLQEFSEQHVKSFLNKCNLIGVSGWELSSDYQTAIRYTGECKELIVPPVKYLGDRCFEGNNNIVKVKIPDTVVSIGEKVFRTVII